MRVAGTHVIVIGVGHFAFERTGPLQNDLGLLAEEYDPRAGRMIFRRRNTAIKLARVEEPAGAQRTAS
jgi:hypothetical protein